MSKKCEAQMNKFLNTVSVAVFVLINNWLHVWQNGDDVGNTTEEKELPASWP